MQENLIIQTKLTELQETVLLELHKTTNTSFIRKKLNIQPITFTKAIQALSEKEMLLNGSLTDKGKKMVHYLEFRNETISLFLKKHKILNTTEINKQLCSLDFKLIIALRNLL
jgi:Mn-dependent DtxR family transcriptional regulator